FGLKLLGVGNEQWGPQYVERYARFAKTLKSKYPDVQLVGASGPDPDGQRFDYLWTQHRRMKTDLVDEHFYRSPQWFLDHTHRYDRYDRAGPKVFAGEYAAHVADRGNTLESALAEAAMMTGFERNADVVRMASYAPLLAHEDAWQWRPNLIWFDNLRVVATPDYYAQQLFSRNRGDVVLSVRLNAEDGAAEPLRTVFASATRDDKAGEIILKIVNAGTNAISAGVHLDGIARRQRVSGTETVLTAESLKAENSFELPRRVTPRLASARWDVPDFDHTFPPCSLTVLRVAAKQ
ncbi:MAG TPA: alpha-L-arabinofuranosidase C-terminal domain-containing protein, partial [Verrucomicrobiae bacterium]|nr:alpha-L-arabinofuranosidase C-terminal domain-containing protein [Verrucomicrobiae bacterium]